MPEAGQPPEDEVALPAPGGDTTVLPPVPSSPGRAGSASARFAAKTELGPRTPAPVLPRPRPRKSAGWWLRKLLPVGGLMLMVGCLCALLGEFPVFGGWPGGEQRETVRPSVGSGLAVVVIDPGHGGIDTGATALGLQEKWLNLDVARRVAQALESAGVRVRMTRTTDEAVSLEERVRIANGTPGAIFVSIHFNDAFAAERGQSSYHASGVETYYSERKEAGLLAGDWMWTSLFGGGKNSGTSGRRDALARSVREGAALADAIQGSLVLATSAADRGTKERGLYVTRRVRAPAVLVEGGFISHPTEAKRLGESAYRQKLAEAIAAGIVRYLQTVDRLPGAGGAGNRPVGA